MTTPERQISPRVAMLPPPYFAPVPSSRAEALIDLSRGDPDLPPPTRALDALREAIGEPGIHRYPIASGTVEIREIFASYYKRRYGVSLDPETEVTLVPGVRTAIMALAAVACADGDVVVVPDPGYPDYLSACLLAGAHAHQLRLDPAGDYQPDWDSLKGVHEALLFLNYPSNPTGACAQPATFAAALDRAERLGSWVVNDFVYGDIGAAKAACSILAHPGAKDRAVELWSGSKSFGMAGWRIGFAVGNPTLIQNIRLYLGHTTGGIWSGFQTALLAALSGSSGELERRAAIYEKRQALFSAHAGGARIVRPKATYYSWLRLPVGTDVAMVEDQTMVRLVDGRLFGDTGIGYARASLTVPEDQVLLAAERLSALAERA